MKAIAKKLMALALCIGFFGLARAAEPTQTSEKRLNFLWGNSLDQGTTNPDFSIINFLWGKLSGQANTARNYSIHNYSIQVSSVAPEKELMGSELFQARIRDVINEQDSAFIENGFLGDIKNYAQRNGLNYLLLLIYLQEFVELEIINCQTILNKKRDNASLKRGCLSTLVGSISGAGTYLIYQKWHKVKNDELDSLSTKLKNAGVGIRRYANRIEISLIPFFTITEAQRDDAIKDFEKMIELDKSIHGDISIEICTGFISACGLLGGIKDIYNGLWPSHAKQRAYYEKLVLLRNTIKNQLSNTSAI